MRQQLRWSRTIVKHLSILHRQRNREIEGAPHEKWAILKGKEHAACWPDVLHSGVTPGTRKHILPLHTQTTCSAVCLIHIRWR